jgi:hypothetical protein
MYQPNTIPANQGLALVNEAIQVEIEAHPQNNKNAVDAYNINSHKHLEVAIVSTVEFDATLFSAASLTLSDANLSGVVTQISTSVQDVNRDGLLDLVADFGTAKDIATAGAIDRNTSVIQLIGILSDDFVTGHDDIKVLGK